jgi:hypothetical protein
MTASARGRTGSCVALAAALALAAPLAAQEPRNTAADVVALTVCVIDADIRTAAIVQWQRGAAREDVLRAAENVLTDSAYRTQVERIVNEIYRAEPAALRPYVAERLERCAAGAARRVTPADADACYQLTRYANDFFTAREAGVALADTVASVGVMARQQGLSPEGEQRLAKLAASVYQTASTRSQFRSALFFRCVTPGTR